MNHPVIALLTDFGENDFFVASLKAVILNLNPEARIVDVSHRIPSFDVDAAGFVLWAAYKFFPQGTIFLAIVDPGVGSRRRILLVKTERYYFIAPDNGVLSLVLGEESIEQVREMTNPRFFLSPLSQTFEGRDKMAPAAAWLSRGASIDMFGPPVKRLKRRAGLKARIVSSEIQGRILYIDKFGNLITNIPAGLFERLAAKKGQEHLTLLVGKERLGGLRENYSAAKKGEVFFLVGSLGLIEISVREASAAKRIHSSLNQEIKIAMTGEGVKK
jgi:S-adenosyl-L-methionine hydrolase (adenosine-forming)